MTCQLILDCNDTKDYSTLNQKQFAFPFNIIWPIICSMRYRTKKFYSWLLILTIVISATQSTIAIELEPIELEGNFQVMLLPVSDTNGTNTGSNCPVGHGDENCADAECCITLCNITPLQFPHAMLLTTNLASQQVLVTNSDTILNHYPDLLKRPPKA